MTLDQYLEDPNETLNNPIISIVIKQQLRGPLMTKTKVVNKHDSMSIDATFEDGYRFRFNVNRGGEYVTLYFQATEAEFEKLLSIIKFKPKETNGERMERLDKALKESPDFATFLVSNS